MTEPELRERFAPDKGWQVLTIREAEFRSTGAPVPAIVACIQREP